MPPPVLGGGGRFFFFLISGRGLPPVGFGGRGDFVSRLGAGGGSGDIAIQNPFPGESSC